MISFLLVASWVALALCSCCTTAVQERIPMQSSLTEFCEATTVMETAAKKRRVEKAAMSVP